MNALDVFETGEAVGPSKLVEILGHLEGNVLVSTQGLEISSDAVFLGIRGKDCFIGNY